MADLLWVFAAFMIAGLVQGMLGFGLAVTSTLLLANRMDFTMLVFLNLCLSFLTCLIAMFYSKNVKAVMKPVLIRLLISALCGLAVGMMMIGYMDSGILKEITLAVILIASVISLGKAKRFFSHPVMTWLTGFLSGVLTPSTGINGPFVVLHLNAVSKHKGQTRNTMLSYLLIIMALGILLMSFHSGLGGEAWNLLPKVVLPAVLGYAIGVLLFRLLSDVVFSRIVIFFLLSSSVLSLIYLII